MIRINMMLFFVASLQLSLAVHVVEELAEVLAPHEKDMETTEQGAMGEEKNTKEWNMGQSIRKRMEEIKSRKSFETKTFDVDNMS